MFADEMDHIDRGMALDSNFSKFSRSTGRASTKQNFGGKAAMQERALRDPLAGRINTAAAIDTRSGRPWWEHSKPSDRKRT